MPYEPAMPNAVIRIAELHNSALRIKETIDVCESVASAAEVRETINRVDKFLFDDVNSTFESIDRVLLNDTVNYIEYMANRVNHLNEYLWAAVPPVQEPVPDPKSEPKSITTFEIATIFFVEAKTEDMRLHWQISNDANSMFKMKFKLEPSDYEVSAPLPNIDAEFPVYRIPEQFVFLLAATYPLEVRRAILKKLDR